MKKIITTAISSTSAMPIKQGTLNHLQDAHTETTEWLNNVFTFERGGVKTSPFRAYGVYTTLSGGTYSIGAGAIYYNGIMYQCDSATVTPVGSQVVIGTITTTYATAANADPVEFSDSTLNNVHEIKKIVWSAGTAGSGTFNFSALKGYNEFDNLIYNASYLTASSGNFTVPGASDFDVKLKELGNAITIDFAITNATLSLATSNVRISTNYPAGIPFDGDFHGLCFYKNSNNTTPNGVAYVTATNGSSLLYIRPTVDATFAAITGGFDLYGQIVAGLKYNP